MNELRLRPYREADLEDLHHIDGSCFPPGIAYSPEELRDFIGHPRAFTLVAECALKIIGFVVSQQESHHLGHIITLDILAGWRRRRLGTLLMDGAEEWLGAQGSRLVYLETAVGEPPGDSVLPKARLWDPSPAGKLLRRRKRRCGHGQDVRSA